MEYRASQAPTFWSLGLGVGLPYLLTGAGAGLSGPSSTEEEARRRGGVPGLLF